MTGAIRPDTNVSTRMPASTASRRRSVLRVSAWVSSRSVGEEFGHDQQCHRADEDPGREDRVLRRPLRKQ